MTHTPGPWKVNKFSGRGPLDDEYTVTYTHPNGYVQTIARVVLGHPESMDGVTANATLIAAAPDMLRALEAVCGESEESDYLMQAQIQAMCRSAIRKARG